MPSKTEPMLTRETLYYRFDGKRVEGPPTRLWGNVGGLYGDVTRLSGNVGKIPPEERPANVSEYVKQ